MHEFVVAAFGVSAGLIPFFADKAKIEIDHKTGRLGLGLVILVTMMCAMAWDDPSFSDAPRNPLPLASSGGVH